MLDIKLFRETPELIKDNLKKRSMSTDIVDLIITADEEWRKFLVEADQLKHKRNVVSEEINALKKKKQKTDAKIKEMKTVAESIKRLDDKINTAKETRDELLYKVPNILHESVPIGKDDSENVPIREWGKPAKKSFELTSHQDVIAKMGMSDFDASAEAAGHGFFYILDKIALLDLALQRFAIDNLTKKGFKLVAGPYMLRNKAMRGLVNLEDFENVIYKIEGEDLYLIATAEHMMGAMHMDKVFEQDQLPLRYVAVSPCFRKEVGAHGIDSRGLFRTHQFMKVEQYSFTTPEQSWDEHEFIQQNSEELFKKLEIPYRVVAICTGDIGGTAAKKYDIEAWFPRTNEYKEVTSCSNCTSYQSRKLNIRYLTETGEKKHVHTLNNTAIATSRAMVAILENYQQKDGTVKVPKVLQPYMNGLKKLT